MSFFPVREKWEFEKEREMIRNDEGNGGKKGGVETLSYLIFFLNKGKMGNTWVRIE